MAHHHWGEMWHGKFPYLSLVASHSWLIWKFVFPTRGFATRWGKIHTTFLLSGGMRHNRCWTKRWNSRRTWNICFIFNFQLKKIRSKIIQITLIELWSFISFELRHFNSMKMSRKAKFGCSIFQLKIKRKQIFQVRYQFGHFVKCRIWHELRINEPKTRISLLLRHTQLSPIILSQE